MVRASILGANGYTGAELVRILARHGGVRISALTSRQYAGQRFSDIYPNLRGIVDDVCVEMDIEKIAETSDVVFGALPHGVSCEVLPQFVERGVKVIDLSGDFRYNDAAVYEKWYSTSHPAPELLEKAVYGLCEIHRDKIKDAVLVGNPGCYTTCSILALAPLLENNVIDADSIIIDAKSGVTGAGRALAQAYHFCECTETMMAYKIATHRHTSEIEQELSLVAGREIALSFTPHLTPMKRGILATCYANVAAQTSAKELLDMYRAYYRGERFVRIYDEGSLPQVHGVAGSNYADIGLVLDSRLGRVVVVAVIDNLVKGASGQAVQNMNIMFGLDEAQGLEAAGLYV